MTYSETDNTLRIGSDSHEGSVQDLPPPKRLPREIPQALKSLPAGLRELRLVFDEGHKRIGEIQTMFSGLHKVKKRMLPYLTKVTLCFSEETDVKPVADDLRAAEVAIVLVDMQRDPRPLLCPSDAK